MPPWYELAERELLLAQALPGYTEKEILARPADELDGILFAAKVHAIRRW